MIMAVEWPDDNVPVPGAQPPAPASGWPARLSGYAKTIAGLIGSLGAGGVLAWLETAGVTHLPGWAEAGITAGVGLLAVLFGPRNKA
jgi:hypothetical protein